MFSAPEQRRHSLQIELSKALYLRGDSLERSERFTRVQSELGDLVASFVRYAGSA
jgi:N-formylglutamate amidohydrolase